MRGRAAFVGLALLALGLQLVLSVAHRHHDSAASMLAATVAPGGQADGADRGRSGDSNHGTAEHGPVEHGPGDHDDDSQCSICWALALGHALIVPLLLAGLFIILRPGKQWVPVYTPVPIARVLAFPFAPRGPPSF